MGLDLNVVKRTFDKINTGGSTKFPNNLSADRYVVIKIYDTSMGDPNKSLAQTAGAVVEVTKSAFNSIAAGKVDLSKITETFGEITKDTTDLLKDAGDNIWDAGKKYLQEFEDVGNPSLNTLGGVEQWMDNLYLPLPNELGESLQHEYDENGKGLLDTISGGTVDAGITSTIGGASDIISKATGTQALIYNHNKLAQFTGSAFRSITLTWTLIANSANEAKNIQEIITKLKAYSSPQAVSGKLLLRAPFFCKLEFRNPIINDALQFKEVVMTSIEVNYSVTGYMETFKDGMPKTISLSVTFKDREPKTLQAWAEGQSGYEFGETSRPKSTEKAGAEGDAVNNTDVPAGYEGLTAQEKLDKNTRKTKALMESLGVIYPGFSQ